MDYDGLFVSYVYPISYVTKPFCIVVSKGVIKIQTSNRPNYKWRDNSLGWKLMASIPWLPTLVNNVKQSQSTEWQVYIVHRHDDVRYWYKNSVCQSVCPSVCPSHSGTVSKRLNIITISSPHSSPIILVLCVSNIFAKFWRDHSLRRR